jgi:FtsZ-binding cell division protein ZapB
MFSLSRWFKISSCANKKQQLPKIDVVASVKSAQATIIPLYGPLLKKEISDQDESAIADMLFADMSANLRAQTEQADLLREEFNNACRKMSTFENENRTLHAENARLQEMIKGLTGSYSKVATNNGEVLKNITTYGAYC